MYLEFAAGQRDYDCSPWSTVTCHAARLEGTLLPDRRDVTTRAGDEFWNGVDWAYWESRQDSMCQNCAMHSGFEASAVRNLHKSPKDALRLAAWNLAG